MSSAWRVRRLIFAGLGLTHAIAFLSLRVQVPGLLGVRGIVPAGATLDAWSAHAGASAPRLLPTLFWWLGTGDATLETACDIGIALALLLAAGIAPSLVLFALWLLYLSLCNVGSVFLGYQWDALLVEATFAAIWLAPGQWRPRDASRVRVPPLALWLLRILLCRLMALSGVVKLASGDPSWRSLEALRFHFETQPLPSWTSVFAHQLPAALLDAGTAATFAIELLLPLLALGPRLARRSACAGFLALQGLIALTGNYGFFNLLTAVLCLSLLDDGDLDALGCRLPLRRRAPKPAPPGALRPGRGARVADAAAGLLLAVSLARAFAQVWPGALPSPVRGALELGARFHSSNGYGLFAVMTTTRPEIEVEVSADGEHWRALVFRWKPGPLERWPRFVEPHMPRLDWQLWFAALQGCQGAPWFLGFAEALLRGSEPVWDLVGEALPEPIPHHLRSTLYLYRFASAEERRATGRVWERERVGPYCPTLSFAEGELRLSPP